MSEVWIKTFMEVVFAGRRMAALMTAVGIWMGMGGSASAALTTFNLGSVITGDSPASSMRPWLTATFDDDYLQWGNNQVALTMSAVNLSGKEDVAQWLFNIDESVTQAQLDSLFIVPGATVTLSGTFISTGIRLIRQVENGVTRAGFSFDFDFGFPNGNTASRFNETDSVRIILGTTMGSGFALTAGLFDYPDDTGTYYSAAHIRNTIGPERSGWIGATAIPVPEPPTLIAGALLLLPFAVSTLRFVRIKRKG